VDQGLGWDEGADDNGLVEYFDLPDLSTPSARPASGQGFTAFQAIITSAGVLGVAGIADGGDMNNPYRVVNPTDISETAMLSIGSNAAAAKRDMVTAALMRGALTNDYITGGGYGTEWLVTFPSRYLHVNVEGGVDVNGDDLPPWVTAAAPFTQAESSKTGEACEVIGFEYWDREEGQVSDPGSIDFSPGGSTPDKFQLCYEVNVMAFNQDAGSSTAVLRSDQIAKYVGLETGYDNGWAKLDFTDFELILGNGSRNGQGHTGWTGLPVIGFMAVADKAGDVLRGATFDHHLDPVEIQSER